MLMLSAMPWTSAGGQTSWHQAQSFLFENQAGETAEARKDVLNWLRGLRGIQEYLQAEPPEAKWVWRKPQEEPLTGTRRREGLVPHNENAKTATPVALHLPVSDWQEDERNKGRIGVPEWNQNSGISTTSKYSINSHRDRRQMQTSKVGGRGRGRGRQEPKSVQIISIFSSSIRTGTKKVIHHLWTHFSFLIIATSVAQKTTLCITLCLYDPYCCRKK